MLLINGVSPTWNFAGLDVDAGHDSGLGLGLLRHGRQGHGAEGGGGGGRHREARGGRGGGVQAGTGVVQQPLAGLEKQ